MTQIFFPKLNPFPALQAWFLRKELPLPNSYGFSSFQNSAAAWNNQIREDLQGLKQDLNRQIYHPSTEDLSRLTQVNQRLQSQGKAAVDFASTTREIEGILNESGSPKEKKEKIEGVRKRLGLSKGEMKRLFTKRLSRIYQQKAQELKQYRNARLTHIRTQIAQAEKAYGPNSPQVQELKRQESALRQTMDPEIQSLSERGKFYGKLYPSFWSKIGGFFKKLGSGILKGIGFIKPLLNFFPGFGSLANFAISGIQTVVKMVKG